MYNSQWDTPARLSSFFVLVKLGYREMLLSHCSCLSWDIRSSVPGGVETASTPQAVVQCTAVKPDIAQHDCDCYAVDDVPPG